MPTENQIKLPDAIDELKNKNRIFMKSIIFSLIETWKHRRQTETDRFEQILETLETFWSKHMSLATQVIVVLQQQNSDLKQQLSAAQQADQADSGAAQQLAT